MTDKIKPVHMLMILDGWGINEKTEGNAVAQANTPFLDYLLETYPHSKLKCSGEAVGLPEQTMGNSEGGHMNIGAGRKVYQDFVRINKAIENKSFFKTPALLDAIKTVSDSGKALHIMGLLSDGGVHSHISHLFALIEMAQKGNVKHLFIHPILDGRDTSPTSGIGYIKELQSYLNQRKYGRIATIVGRYWAMDRDTRWNRVEKAYDLYTMGLGTLTKDPVTAVQNAYDKNRTDEFLKPVIINTSKAGLIKNGDGIVFFNFRADRAKEITSVFTETNFSRFKKKKHVLISNFVCMTQYDENFGLPVAFAPQHLENIFGKILSQEGLSQLRIAETEKYAHVTYFFNGGDEIVFENEDRILIPSPRDVATYDERPEMSAVKLAETACEKIQACAFDFIILNFANMDMVGHTGILPAAIQACETVDVCVEKVVAQVLNTGGSVLVTADHGNSEQMVTEDGSPHTAHTLNPVRLILASDIHKGITLKDGILGDIAPTILKILNIKQPDQMTGSPLI